MFGLKKEKAVTGPSINDLVAAAMEGSPSGVFINCLAPGREGIVYVNQSFLNASGYPSLQAVQSMPVAQILAKVQYGDKTVSEFTRTVEEAIKSQGKWSGRTVYNKFDGGSFGALVDVSLAMIDGVPLCLCRVAGRREQRSCLCSQP